MRIIRNNSLCHLQVSVVDTRITSKGGKNSWKITSLALIKLEMAEPATGGPSLPESICRYDERVQVNPTTSPPKDWICSLLIESATDGKYFGSGLVIHTILMA